MAMSFQLIVCGVAPSEDVTEWGIVVVGLTHGGPQGRAVVLGDESGRMSGHEMAGRVASLARTGKIAVAPVAKPAGARVTTLLGMVASGGFLVPPVHEVAVKDTLGLWTGLLKSLYEGERLVHGGTFQDLERTLREYQPTSGEPTHRIEALLAAVTYLQSVGGLASGATWETPLCSPSLAEALDVGHPNDRPALVQRLGGVADRGDIG